MVVDAPAGGFALLSGLMNAVSKAALRSEVLARRGLVTAGKAQAFARRLADVGAAFAAERATKIVSSYWSINDEAQTFLLLDKLAAQGVATALPVMQGRGAPLCFRLWKKGEPLAEVKWGINEPLGPEVFPDLLFVPLAAFDRAGNRLGYGAGFYDRTLSRLRAMQRITAIGVAYAVQEVPAIPSEAYDQKLDYVLTDREWIVCA
jgi:5-formyltetrahydrofolate cyclo-ligase